MNRAREGYKNDKKWGKCKNIFVLFLTNIKM